MDVDAIARRVKEDLADISVPLTVAVMGCVVNGPGEAKEADVGLAGGGFSVADAGNVSDFAQGALFERGRAPRRVEGNLAEILVARAREIAKAKEVSA